MTFFCLSKDILVSGWEINRLKMTVTQKGMQEALHNLKIRVYKIYENYDLVFISLQSNRIFYLHQLEWKLKL